MTLQLPRTSRMLLACALTLAAAAAPFIAPLPAHANASSAAAGATSSDGAWTAFTPSEARSVASIPADPWIRPDEYKLFQLDSTVLLSKIAAATPATGTAARGTASVILTVPTPDGSFQRFRVVDAPVMEPGLASQLPDVRTLAGQGIDDPAATIRLDWTPQGFHASVLSPSGMWYVDPYWKNDNTVYSSYRRDALTSRQPWRCGTQSTPESLARRAAVAAASESSRAISASGSTLRTYRLACAATAEYTAFHGGTVPLAQAAIVTAINRVNQVYEADFAIHLTLVANNTSIVYTNSGSDPYTNDDGDLLISQNQTNVTTVIGSANYDIGHVFGTGGGGLAGLGVVCQSSQKARGQTGSPAPISDAFYIDYVAHEMGHQFGANHSFNGVTDNCSGGNRSGTTAMEPGSGSTIMCYAGICGVDDLQSNSDPYFHSISYDEIMAYVTGTGTCSVNSSTGNTAPTVSAGLDYAIPINTPFTLTGSASDVNGDTLTYCWEQRDLGAAQLVTAADNGVSPLFRSFSPVSSASRTFPKLSDIINNTTSTGEKYPTVSRAAMKFRLTVRDNRAGGGGVNTDDMQLQVVGSAGPFAVTSPNASVTLSGQQTVTWNVANTTASPISTSLVNIRLSTDGGLTFPTLLSSNTANDGSEVVTLPNLSSSTARIKVEAVNNVYWDMSNANFTITPPPAGADSSWLLLY